MPRKTHVHGHVAQKHPFLKAALKKHPSLRKNLCFGCGKDNPEGLRLKFHYDQASNQFVAHFRLPKRFTGPPRHAHGGVIAAILDEAMSKPSKPLGIIAPTIELAVSYLRPVPLGKKLTVAGWEEGKAGREHRRVAEIRNEKGELLSAGKGKFLEMHVEGLMEKFLTKGKVRKA